MGSGCRVLSIAGAILAIVLAILVVILWLNWDKIQVRMVQKSADVLQTKVLENLPEGYNLDEIKALFKDFKDYMGSGGIKAKLNSPEMQVFSSQVLDVLKDKKIDKAKLDKLLELMRKIVGK
jgi:hypothetical protein